MCSLPALLQVPPPKKTMKLWVSILWVERSVLRLEACHHPWLLAPKISPFHFSKPLSRVISFSCEEFTQVFGATLLANPGRSCALNLSSHLRIPPWESWPWQHTRNHMFVSWGSRSFGNTDAIFPGSVSDSTGEGPVPQDWPPHQMPVKAQATDGRFPQPRLGFNMLDWLT